MKSYSNYIVDSRPIPKIVSASRLCPETEVNLLVRVFLKVGLQTEIQDLIRILDENILVDLAFLKKRTRAVHTLCMKYYFAKASDEQKGKIDTLVGRDKGNQQEALEYLERIVSRSFKSLLKQ